MYALWLGDDGLPWKVGVSAVDRVHSLGLCLVTLSFRLLHSMRPTHDLSQWLGERGHLPLQVSKNRRGDAAGGNSPYVYILTGVFDGPKQDAWSSVYYTSDVPRHYCLIGLHRKALIPSPSRPTARGPKTEESGKFSKR